MKDNKFEIRIGSFSVEPNQESRIIKGVGIPVNSRSQLLADSFYETIAPESISQEWIDTQDVRVLYNHNTEGFSLARSRKGKGSLSLRTENDGLHFEFEMPKSGWADHILEEIRRGDITNCSFGFVCGKDEWIKRADGYYDRVIKSFDYLSEISLCDVETAYVQTSVATRSLEQFKEQEKRNAEEEQKRIEDAKVEADKKAEEEKVKMEEEEKKRQELKEYYDNLKKGLD